MLDRLRASLQLIGAVAIGSLIGGRLIPVGLSMAQPDSPVRVPPEVNVPYLVAAVIAGALTGLATQTRRPALWAASLILVTLFWLYGGIFSIARFDRSGQVTMAVQMLLVALATLTSFLLTRRLRRGRPVA